MKLPRVPSKTILRKAGNVILIGTLLLFIFSPNAKSWMLRQLIATGLFNAKIKKESPAPNVPANLLSFSFRDDQGFLKSTGDLKGKVVFINFWATWCPPCRAEMPSLQALYNELREDDRFVFLFINQDDGPAKAKSYLRDNGYDLPLIFAPGAIPEEIFSGTLPTTVVLNKEGRLVFKKEGMAGYDTRAFARQLKELL